jgi:hypothetical protein
MADWPPIIGDVEEKATWMIAYSSLRDDERG